MKRKFLEELGIEKDVIDKIMAEHGKTSAELASKKEDIQALEKQLSDRDTDLKKLKDEAGDNAELKTKYQDLEAKYKEDKTAFEAKLKENNINHAIETSLLGKVYDSKIVAGLIDKEKIVISEDGNVIGLDEQVKALHDEKAFLFVPNKEETNESATPRFTGGGNPQNNIGQGDGDKLGKRLAEYKSRFQ